MLGLRVFRVHLDGELFIQQQHEGDGAAVGLHVEQARVLHHQPATQTHTHTCTHTLCEVSECVGYFLLLLVLLETTWEELKRGGDVGGRSRGRTKTCGILFCFAVL